jgi:hypothetical protein
LETNKFEVQQATVDFLLNELDKRASIPYEGIIQTEVKFEIHVFRDICTLIGIDYKKYQLKEKAIDTLLCGQEKYYCNGRYLIVDYDGLYRYL